MTTKPIFVSLGLSLSLCVACGSTDNGNNNTAGGAGGSPMTSAGSSSGGSSSAGSNAGGAPSTGSFSSGLPGDKQITALTDPEFAGLCQKMSDYFSTGAVGMSVEEVMCRFSGMFAGIFAQTDAAVQAACKSTYDACKAAPTMTEETCNRPGASCTATIAEYDACVNDSIKSLIAAGMVLPTCDKLTMASLETIDLGANESSAACKVLDMKCPGAPKPPSPGDLASGGP